MPKSNILFMFLVELLLSMSNLNTHLTYYLIILVRGHDDLDNTEGRGKTLLKDIFTLPFNGLFGYLIVIMTLIGIN